MDEHKPEPRTSRFALQVMVLVATIFAASSQALEHNPKSKLQNPK